MMIVVSHSVEFDAKLTQFLSWQSKAEPNKTCTIVDDDGSLAVTLRAGVHLTSEGFILAASVIDVMVREDLRRQGRFQEFICRLLQLMTDFNYKQLNIENVSTSPAALEFCKKFELDEHRTNRGIVDSYFTLI